jgi:hypothetical protein
MGYDLDLLEQDIVNALKGLTVEANLPENEKKFTRVSAPWTIRIMELIGGLGCDNGYEVCGAGFDSQWLYDLVWYKNDEKKMLESVQLVLESEWNTSLEAIKYDFEKLLIANAEMKVMICEAKSSDMLNKLFEYFENAIKGYRLGKSGERYLIAILDENWDFNWRLLIKP